MINKDDEFVYLFDKRQVTAYMKNNVYPVKVKLDKKDRIIFVFKKSETNELYTLWREHKLSWQN